MTEFVASANITNSRERYHGYLTIVQIVLPIQMLLAVYAACVQQKNDVTPFFETFQRLFWLNFLWLVLIANNIFFDPFEEMIQKRYGSVFTFNQGSFVLFILSISFSSMLYRIVSVTRGCMNANGMKN